MARKILISCRCSQLARRAGLVIIAWHKRQARLNGQPVTNRNFAIEMPEDKRGADQRAAISIARIAIVSPGVV
jgi:hypothetical protein